MKIIIKIIFPVLILFSLFNGKWEAVYALKDDNTNANYLIDLNSNVFWDKPSTPTLEQFKIHFSNLSRSLPENGVITLNYNWGLVFTNFVFLSIITSAILAVLIKFNYKHDQSLTGIGRFFSTVTIISSPIIFFPGLVIIIFIPAVIIGLLITINFNRNQKKLTNGSN